MRAARLALGPALALGALVALGATVAGCGYGLAEGTNLPPEARTISIRVFRNHSREPGLEVRLRQAVEDEFRRRGRLEVVDKGADLVLTGDIRTFASIPVAADTTDAALQYQAVMEIAIRLVERTSGKVVYKTRGFTQTQDFGAVNSVVITSSPSFQRGTINARDLAQMTSVQIGEARRRDATRELLDRAAREVYAQTMEGF
jgi:hypothetical protein